MTLIYLVVAWAAGVLLAPSSVSHPVGWLALAAGSAVLGLLVRANSIQRMAFMILMMFALGAGRCAWAVRPLPSQHIAHRLDSGYATLTGRLVAPPDVRDRHVNLRVEIDSVRQGGVTAPAQGVVLAQGPRYGSYAYGDRVSIAGMLLTPPEFDTFSYRDYLARRGIHALVPNAVVEVLAHDAGSPWLAVVFDLKGRAQHLLDRMLPSPQAPLLSGILLGEEGAIDPDVREAFSRTGTSHIIAISGANVVIVLRALTGLLAPLGIRRARWLAVGGVALYAVFVGGDATVVRAAIMGSVTLLAMQTGRKAHGLTTLAFAVWLMSLGSPYVLWDVGFQLSVAATIGLILFADDGTRLMRALLERLFARETARQVTGWLTEPVAVTMAAQITTTPLIVFHFGQLSMISLLANVLIIPVQPYIMIGGWLALLASAISPVLGTLLAWIVWLPLTFTLAVVRRLAEVEWASIPLSVGEIYVGLFYVILLAVAWLRIQHPDDRGALWGWMRQRVTPLAAAACGVVVAVLVWALALTQPDGRLHIWFLDVGDGHAVLIQSPQGAHVLVDGGDSPTRLRRAVGDALPFWDRDLDVVIVTQSQRGAVESLLDLLQHYDAGALIGPNERWLDEFVGDRMPIQPVRAGWRVETGDGLAVEVLAPQASPGLTVGTDDTSLILRVRYGDASFLIAPEVGERALLRVLDAGWYVGSTVLELPAQGSQISYPDTFLAAVHPQAAVVELAAGTRTDLPAAETLERLNAEGQVPLFRTDHHGTIEMVTDGRRLWVYTAR